MNQTLTLAPYRAETYDPPRIAAKAAAYLKRITDGRASLLRPYPEGQMLSTIRFAGVLPVVSPTGALYVAAGATDLTPAGRMILREELTTNITAAERTLDALARRLRFAHEAETNPQWFDCLCYAAGPYGAYALLGSLA